MRRAARLAGGSLTVGAIAKWLVLRPWNGALALALTLLLPFAPILSGAVMGFLVLAQGLSRATVAGGAAALLLVVLFVAFGNPAVPMLINALTAWLPVALLAALMRGTRSLTLALQVSAIVAMLVTVGFFVVLGDPAPFWSDRLTELAAVFTDMGLGEQAAVLTAQRETIASQMTMLFVFISWSTIVLVLVLGYAFFGRLPDKRAPYGRFCDLDLGRVLALLMAAISLLALVSTAAWVENLAFVAFAVFWVQGLAILHWLRADGPLPFFVLVAVYALLPVLNVLLVVALAVLGYVDAWFGFRPRLAARIRQG